MTSKPTKAPARSPSSAASASRARLKYLLRTGFAEFRNFAIRSMCVENVDFYDAVQKYKMLFPQFTVKDDKNNVLLVDGLIPPSPTRESRTSLALGSHGSGTGTGTGSGSGSEVGSEEQKRKNLNLLGNILSILQLYLTHQQMLQLYPHHHQQHHNHNLIPLLRKGDIGVQDQLAEIIVLALAVLMMKLLIWLMQTRS
jgi:hypothetical protein